jgi:glycosyltransferase involved in cell wall biosynthesis
MNETCYVASLKYSPVMWSHGRGFGEPIREAGHPVRYLLAAEYEWLSADSGLEADLLPVPDSSNPLSVLLRFLWSGGMARAREVFRKNPPGVLLFVNLNPLIDRMLIRTARKSNPAVRVVCYLHEPRTTEKLVYGWRRALLLGVFELFTYSMAKASDAIALPSSHAEEIYKRFYGGLGKPYRVISLPFADAECKDALERRYISFVGHIGNAYQKGVDLFLEMIEESFHRPGEYAFQLVTGEDPGKLLDGLSARAQGRLRVVFESPLSDQEISRAIRESIAVVLLQRRVMQSGVLPVALMNGTPVIASDLTGFTQYIEDGETGRILPVEPSLDQRFEAIEDIRRDLDAMSTKCRSVYERTFDSRMVASSVFWLLGRTQAADARS